MAKGGGGAAKEATRVGRPKATTVSRSDLGAARAMAGRPGGANKTSTGNRPRRVTRAGK